MAGAAKDLGSVTTAVGHILGPTAGVQADTDAEGVTA